MHNYLKESIILLFLIVLTLPVYSQSIGWESLGEPGDGGAVTSIRVDPYNSSHILLGGDIMGASYSLDGGLTWQDAYGFNDYCIGDFSWHPTDSNTVWAGTMSGPFKSTDGGRHWQMMRTGMDPISDWIYTCPVQKILFDPSDSNHLLAFGGSFRDWFSPGTPKWNALWESNDGGDHWSQLTTIGNESAPGILNAVYGGNNKIVVAAYGQGVYISTDNGITWNASNTGLSTLNVAWVTVDPGDSSILYCSTKNYLSGGTHLPGGVFKSVDGGNTWSNISTGLSQYQDPNPEMASYYRMVKVSPTDSDVLYTANGGWLNSTTFKSTDAGASWTALFTTAPAINTPVFYNYSAPELYVFDFDPHNGNVLIGGNWEYVLKTTDGGVHWDDMMSDTTSTPGYFTGVGYSGIASIHFEFNPFNASEAVFQGMDDAKFVISKDNLLSWKRGGDGMSRMNGGTDLSFSDTDGTTIYCTTGQNGVFDGVWKSTDGGDHWTGSDYTDFPGCTQLGGQPLGVYAIPDHSDTVWVSAQNKIYKSTNGGITWTEIFSSLGMSTIAPSKDKPTTFYVNSQDGVYKTTDGINFNLMVGSPRSGRNILVDPNNDQIIYLTKYKTDDGEEGLWKYDGVTWSMIKSDYNMFNVAVQPGNSQVIMVITHDEPFHDIMASTGVWMSIDGGENWVQHNSGLPIRRGNCLAFNPHEPDQVILGLAGRGFYKTNIGSLLGVNTSSASSLFDLRIYPSPAINYVNISFSLETSSKVDFEMYNLIGQRVKTLFSRHMDRGPHLIQIQKGDLASGIYFIRMNINGIKQTKKLVIMY